MAFASAPSAQSFRQNGDQRPSLSSRRAGGKIVSVWRSCAYMTVEGIVSGTSVGREGGRMVWRCSLPKSYDHLGRENGQSDGNGPLAWKDRVALYAQFSAEETLDMLLLALRENSLSGPMKDDGIDALYAFANVDIWALTHRFFGKKMDLGQFERFKRVLVASPYDVLLRYRRVRTLSALRVRDDTYVSRRVFEAPGRAETVFTFTMSRQAFGGGGKRAWMVDSIIHEAVQ